MFGSVWIMFFQVLLFLFWGEYKQWLEAQASEAERISQGWSTPPAKGWSWIRVICMSLRQLKESEIIYFWKGWWGEGGRWLAGWLTFCSSISKSGLRESVGMNQWVLLWEEGQWGFWNAGGCLHSNSLFMVRGVMSWFCFFPPFSPSLHRDNLWNQLSQKVITTYVTSFSEF